MFTEEKRTIPAAGEFELIDISGRSVFIEDLPAYSDKDDRPLLYFQSPQGQEQKLYKGRTIFYDTEDKGFDRVYIKGTAASAGDDLRIWFTNLCLKDDTPYNALDEAPVVAGATFFVSSADAGQVLSNANKQDADGILARAMNITCVDFDVRYTFGGTAASQGDGHLITVGESHRILGRDFVDTFNHANDVLNATAGGNGGLWITMEF